MKNKESSYKNPLAPSWYERAHYYLNKLERNIIHKNIDETIEQNINDCANFMQSMGYTESQSRDFWRELTGYTIEELLQLPSISIPQGYSNTFTSTSLLLSEGFGCYLESFLEKYSYSTTINPFEPEYQNNAGSFRFGVCSIYPIDKNSSVRSAIYTIPENLCEALISTQNIELFNFLQFALDMSHHDLTAHAVMLYSISSSKPLDKLLFTQPLQIKILELLDSASKDTLQYNNDYLGFFETWSIKHHLDISTTLIRRRPSLLRLIAIKTIQIEKLTRDSNLSQEQQELLLYIWSFSMNRIIHQETMFNTLFSEKPALRKSHNIIEAFNKKYLRITEQYEKIKEIKQRPTTRIGDTENGLETKKALLLYKMIQEELVILKPLYDVLNLQHYITNSELNTIRSLNTLVISKLIVYAITHNHGDFYKEDNLQIMTQIAEQIQPEVYEILDSLNTDDRTYIINLRMRITEIYQTLKE